MQSILVLVAAPCCCSASALFNRRSSRISSSGECCSTTVVTARAMSTLHLAVTLLNGQMEYSKRGWIRGGAWIRCSQTQAEFLDIYHKGA